MLTLLRLMNVGPAPAMEMELAPRFNLITGDNGLGKSFLLDVAWWALTRRWPHEVNAKLTSGYTARPTEPKSPAAITFSVTSKTKAISYTSTYSPRDESWLGKAGRPWNPGLVIYAHADGGFSVWDPARNYWKKRGNIDIQDRLPAYVFSPKEVWDGLTVEVDGRETTVCNGLVRDWASWVRAAGSDADLFAQLIAYLSPPSAECIRPGALVRLSVNDARDIPSIKTGYSASIPIVHASAGIRRMVALAYMLLWTWKEHEVASELLGEERTNQVVFLIDELESHLHPQWQRTVLGALLELVKHLHQNARIQIVAATHSPLILASAEPFFDAANDAWFDLDLKQADGGHQVELAKRDFVRRGDVSNWLTSDAFGLREARSLPAEDAISKALELTRSSNPPSAAIAEVDALLREALSDIDRFWLRWAEFRRQREPQP